MVSDNSGTVSATCDPPSGTVFTMGLTIVNCEAIDGSGNIDSCSFEVNVTGIFSLPYYLTIF